MDRPPLLQNSEEGQEFSFIHEGIEHLFSLEEVLERLYQSQGTGCLLIYNREQAHQVFIRQGRVRLVTGPGLKKESGLEFLSTLTQPRYQWVQNLLSPRQEVDLCIQTFLLQQSYSRDLVLSGHLVRQTSRLIHPQANEKKTSPPPALPLYHLEAKDGSGFRLQLTKAVTILGREAPPSDLAVPHAFISRRHCLIKISAQHVFLEDLESSNGTFVNDVYAKKEISLQDKDIIKLGNYALTLLKQTAPVTAAA